MAPNPPIPNLTPVYVTPTPDAPIPLATGRFAIQQGSYTGEGDGTLTLVWASQPRLRFYIPSLDPVGLLSAGKAVLRHLASNAEGVAQVTTTQHSQGQPDSDLGAQGHLTRNMIMGADQPADHVIFHLVNFWNYVNPCPNPTPPEYYVHRLVFEGAGWRVTLQAVEKVRDLVRDLDADSGYAITHAGKVERVDGSSFPRSQAQELFSALYYFFSFVRGFWCPSILYVARDAVGTELWQDWTVLPVTPWTKVLSWFPSDPGCLATVFPGFLRLWQNPDWQDILRVVIHWYVETNLQAGAIEGAIILCQNALERLAYYVLVHDRHVLPETAFQQGGGMTAAHRLRLLFTEFGLPLDVGPNTVRITNLPALAASRKWDAPQALVNLRNCIIHPDQHNNQRLQNYPIPARTDAWIIGLWYLDVILLKLFGHTGCYVNRRSCRFEGEVESVP